MTKPEAEEAARYIEEAKAGRGRNAFYKVLAAVELEYERRIGETDGPWVEYQDVCYHVARELQQTLTDDEKEEVFFRGLQAIHVYACEERIID